MTTKMPILMLPVLGLFAAAAPAAAESRVLDFTQGNYCRGGQLCTNNGNIDQSYGDTANLDLTYQSFANGRTSDAFYYERGFGDLVGVIFAGNGFTDARGQITFQAAEGFELSLTSFDTGCFGGQANCRTMDYRLTSGATLLAAATVDTNSPTHRAVTLNSAYARQLVLNFGAGDNVGLDNIRFDIRPSAATPAVPEPATWAMMIGGFGLVGGTMRRRTPALANA